MPEDSADEIERLRAENAELRRLLAAVQGPVQSGSGAVASSSGVAAGAHGVAAGGDVLGDVFVGNTINLYRGRYSGAPSRDPAEALSIYCHMQVAQYRHLSLRGLDVGSSDPTGSQQRLDLAQVYVDLHTTTEVPIDEAERQRRGERPGVSLGKTRRLGALEAVITHRRLVLLGDPGSGKSTFLTYLALCLAACHVDRGGEWLARLPGWPAEEAEAVPVSVVLRDFARWLPARAKRAEARHLWGFIKSRLEAQNLAFAERPLQRRLEDGKVLLLLDGLDEIPTERQLSLVRDAVVVFAERYSRCRLIITCRTLSYQNPAWQLASAPSFTLAPFDAEQIDRFIAAWYGELARLGSIKAAEVDAMAQHLRAAVRRPDLWRLAPNPLLLTVMALVHAHRGRLPEARARLYEETVDTLLWQWEEVKTAGDDEGPRLRRLLRDANCTEMDLKRALWRLAFEAHRHGGTVDAESVADIGELRLYKELIGLHPDKSLDWARQLVEVMKLRAGLLLERVPEVYAFPHRTFQEYLAGAYLSTEPDFATQACRLVAEGAFWREAVLLAVGRLVHVNGELAKPLELAAELCPAQPAATEIAWW